MKIDPYKHKQKYLDLEKLIGEIMINIKKKLEKFLLQAYLQFI
jgi:hypothetical protein